MINPGPIKVTGFKSPNVLQNSYNHGVILGLLWGGPTPSLICVLSFPTASLPSHVYDWVSVLCVVVRQVACSIKRCIWLPLSSQPCREAAKKSRGVSCNGTSHARCLQLSLLLLCTIISMGHGGILRCSKSHFIVRSHSLSHPIGDSAEKQWSQVEASCNGTSLTRCLAAST